MRPAPHAPAARRCWLRGLVSNALYRQAAPSLRAWARGGATEIVRGGFLVIATDGDGEVVDLPKWAIESAKTRFADPSTGPFQASAEFMREVRRGLGEQIEQAGRTPSDIAALASQLAAKPGDDGGAGGKRI